MATKTNTIEKNGRLKVPTLPSVFSRAIKANSEWPEKVSSFFFISLYPNWGFQI
jgi:hypothetical protein